MAWDCVELEIAVEMAELSSRRADLHDALIVESWKEAEGKRARRHRSQCEMDGCSNPKQFAMGASYCTEHARERLARMRRHGHRSPTIGVCNTEGCTNAKIPGSGQRYCLSCREENERGNRNAYHRKAYRRRKLRRAA